MSFKPLIELAVRNGTNFGYNDAGKQKFKTTSMKFLKELAKDLGYTGPLTKKQLYFNPGGVAVNGDPTLMIMMTDTIGLYIKVCEPFNQYNSRGFQILYRTIKNDKDFTGGNNHQSDVSTDYDTFIMACKQLIA